MADENDSLSSEDIEALLNGGGQARASASAPQASQASGSADLGDAVKPRDQDDVGQLLRQGGAGPPPELKASAQRQRVHDDESSRGGSMPQGDVEYLLNQAQRALESIDSGSEAGSRPGLAQFRFEEFTGERASTENATLDLISEVELDLKIELGRTHLYLEDILKLRKGSVVALDKLAGDPVDVYVNGRLIARGEVLVLNDNFCVRVGELIAGVDPNG